MPDWSASHPPTTFNQPGSLIPNQVSKPRNPRVKQRKPSECCRHCCPKHPFYPVERRIMSPGPIGNRNRVTHGMRMELNELPNGCGRIRRERYRMRSLLEKTVLERDGQIEPYQAATIQTAIRWATHAALAARWLRIEPDLTIEQKLALSRDVARASESRDRCLKLLGLDKRSGADPWDTVLTASQPASEPSAGNGCSGHDATSDEVELRENASQC